MKGTVRTENKCPRCGKKFQETPRGLRCVKCKTTPDKYYIDFLWNGERIRVFRYKDSDPFTSYEAAKRFLTVMRAEVDAGRFSPKDYIRVEIRGLQFTNYAIAWLDRRNKEVEQGLLSRGYLRSSGSYIRNHMGPFFRDRSVKDIHEGFIEDFQLQLPKHLKPKTIKNIMGLLQKIFADACHKRRDIARMPVFPEIPVGKPGFNLDHGSGTGEDIGRDHRLSPAGLFPIYVPGRVPAGRGPGPEVEMGHVGYPQGGDLCFYG